MTEPLSTEQLDKIRARVSAAFPGPWYVDSLTESDGTESFGVATEEDAFIVALQDLNPADAEFIARARQDVPALLAELDRARAAMRSTSALLRSVASRSAAGQLLNPGTARQAADDLDRIAGGAR